MEKGELHAGFKLGNLKETDDLEDLEVDGRINLNWVLNKQDENSWAVFIWLRIAMSGGLFWTPAQTTLFRKMQGISLLAKELLSCQNVLRPMELVF